MIAMATTPMVRRSRPVARGESLPPRTTDHGPRTLSAFTLIELMVVCAIIGLVMTISIPTIYRHLHPESMQKAVSDVMEACSTARALAILNGAPTELVIHPLDRQIEVVPAASSEPDENRLASPSVSGKEWRMPERSAAKPPSGGGGGGSTFSVRISDAIMIEMVDVNFVEYKDAEIARVRFHPNGTSDEFTIVLHGDNNEWRKISLEVVTALADVETDPNKWRDR